MSIKRYDVGMTTENNPHGFNHSFPCVYEAEQGKYVEYEDYARLKAEVEAWKDMVADSGVACNERARENQDLENQIERLKAEVDRLTSNLLGRDATIMGLDSTIKCKKAQVERLTKAGDAFYEGEIGYYGEQILDNYNHGTGEICRAWNAAKKHESK
jgi:hypothetical protein